MESRTGAKAAQASKCGGRAGQESSFQSIYGAFRISTANHFIVEIAICISVSHASHLSHARRTAGWKIDRSSSISGAFACPGAMRGGKAREGSLGKSSYCTKKGANGLEGKQEGWQRKAAKFAPNDRST